MIEIIAGLTEPGAVDQVKALSAKEGSLLVVYLRPGGSYTTPQGQEFTVEPFIMTGRMSNVQAVKTGYPGNSKIEWRVGITNQHFELSARDILRIYAPSEQVDIPLGFVMAKGRLWTGEEVTREEMDEVIESIAKTF